MKHWNYRMIPILVAVFGIILLAIISMFWGQKANSLPDSLPSQAPTQTQNRSLPPVLSGYEQYVDNELRYGYNHRNGKSVLRIETLGTYDFTISKSKTSLMNTDLFCSADGPGSSIYCKNTKVEDYTNSLGTKGFIVSRTKTVTGKNAGIPPGTYKDMVYVYPLPEIVKGPGVSNSAAIMLAVDYPSQPNLVELQAIADSFFTL